MRDAGAHLLALAVGLAGLDVGAVLLGTKREAWQRTLDDGRQHAATKDLRSEQAPTATSVSDKVVQ